MAEGGAESQGLLAPSPARDRPFAALRGVRGQSLLLALLLPSLTALAAAPTLDHLHPAGGQQGTTVAVNIVGKTDPWPVQVWTDTPALAFKADKDKGKYNVEIAKDAPPGPHLVRLYNDEGASTLRFFLVSRTREEPDKEPNDAFASPQRIESLPVIVNGRLDKNGDADSFAVSLEAGQWLIASVDAFRLASTVDALLRLTDTNGVTLAFNHDGRTFDPFLAWRAPRAGVFVVQIMGFAYPATASERLGGGAGCIYRLTLSTGPWLEHAFPPAVPRDRQTTLQLIGWNLAKDARKVDFPFDPSAPAGEANHAEVQWPGALNTLRLLLSTLPEHRETEPNDSREQAQKVAVPVSINGVISKAGDEDRFAFEAKKGDKLRLEIQSASLGFPLDAWLRVEDAGGKELAKDDDSRESADPSLEWTAPADGVFAAAVGGVMRKGGEEHIYRLEITRPEPSFEATVAANAFTVAPGKTNEVKVTVRRRHGHDRKLTLTAQGLPAGVSAEPVEVPEKGGDATVKLAAAPDAKPHNGLWQLFITQEGRPPRPVSHELTSRGIDNGVPQGFTSLVIEQTDQLWLTVLAKQEEKPAEPK